MSRELPGSSANRPGLRGRSPDGGLRISIGRRSLARAEPDPDTQLLAVSDAREPLTVAVTIRLALAVADPVAVPCP